ncbi:MAG: glycoside hydrolase family 9 protein, partial [Lachnospiraceae bacterium]|nr:glycoside hydrolase family 9 protein [Lachnospiraceae bacterium]
AEHEGQKKVYCGGWHDAGDLSQQTLQTGEVVHALYEMAEKVKDDTLLYNRLMEEAGWGLDFLIRTRFANGYRATSVGCMRFTDQIIGNADDEPVRVGNRSFDNFVMGAIEAASALRLQEYDLDKSFIAIKAAREDFDYAHRRFMSVGIEEGMDKEHTYNAGLSQYYAAAAWCGGQIYKVSGELYYAFEAAKYGKKLLACQDIGNADLAFDGFFYRDMDKEVITHFNHQGRDHLYTLALVTLCEIEKDNYQRKTWEYALKRYGAYLKTMRKFASPYGMQPSGVHAYNEALDAETFRFMHFYTDYETDKDNYQAQLAAGIKLNDKFCIRQFPIWFSFRGNSAVILSAGKAAAMIGRYFGDEKLLDIARDQLYWNAGKNPFAQSLMYGEGANYAQQYASLLGETVGEMPVGIQTRENEDVPFYPSANYCTYKEVWMSVIGRWLYVLADIL